MHGARIARPPLDMNLAKTLVSSSTDRWDITASKRSASTSIVLETPQPWLPSRPLDPASQAKFEQEDTNWHAAARGAGRSLWSDTRSRANELISKQGKEVENLR